MNATSLLRRHLLTFWRYAACLSTLTCLTIPAAALANSVETVLATGDSGGDCVWKVVTASNENETSLAPGIYSRGEKRHWDVPLVLGNVAGRRDASGLMQLSLTAATKRLEAWAVVDGKIILFHIDSSLQDKSSFIVIGDDEHALYDPHFPTKRRVVLPPITSLDDLNYVAREPGGYPRGQDLLISVRNPQSTFTGMDGITFVIRLAGDSQNNGPALRLSHPVYVLDYHFRSHEQLASLAVDSGYLSYNQLDDLMAIQADEPYVVQAWKQRLAAYVRQRQFYELPYFSAQQGKFIYRNLPSLQHRIHNYAGQVGITATYPLDGKGVQVNFSNAYGASKNIYGEPDFREGELQGQRDLASLDLSRFLQFESDRQQSTVFYLNKQRHLLWVGPSAQMHILTLNEGLLLGALPDRQAVHTIADATAKTMFLFVSEASGSRAETRVYKFSTADNRLTYTSEFLIDERFRSSDILKKRIYSDDTGIHFDYLSDPAMELQEYLQGYDKTVPHLDVKQSLSKGFRQVSFRKALVDKELGRGIHYLAFNNQGISENYNGLYRIDAHGVREPLLLGEVLARHPEEGKAAAELPLANLLLDERDVTLHGGNIRLRAFAIDPSHQQGQRNFRVVLIASPNTDGAQADAYDQKIDYAFSALDRVIFHGGQSPAAEANIIGILIVRKSHGLRSGEVKVAKLELGLPKKLSCSDRGPCTIFGGKAIKYLMHRDGSKADGTSIATRLISDINTSAGGTTSPHHYYGELLRSPKQPPVGESERLPFDSAVLDSKVVAAGTKDSTKLQVFALDRDFNGGASSFLLVIKATHLDSKNVQYYVKSINLPVQALSGISLQADLSHDPKLRGRFGMIYTLAYRAADHPAYSEDKPGFHSVFFNQINMEDMARMQIFNLPRESFLEATEAPAIEEIQAKLLSDAEGNLYWPINDKPSSARMFEVRSLYTTSTLFPNQSGLKLTSARKENDYVQYREDGHWRLRKPVSGLGRTELPTFFSRLPKDELEEYRNIVFGNLEKELEDLSSAQTPKRHKVLIVSKEVKRYVIDAIAARWLLPEGDVKKRWGHHNKQLAVYYFTGERPVDQEAVYKNFKGMGGALTHNEVPVFIADLKDISTALQPPPGDVDQPYTIAVPEEGSAAQAADGTWTVGDNVHVDKKLVTPSLLYMLASEGRYVDLEKFPGRGQPELSMLLVGTPEEWQQIKTSVSVFERSQGLIEDFEELTLATPSREQRSQLLMKVLDDKAPLFNGIRYDGSKIVRSDKELTPEALQAKVVDYAVARSHALAQQRGQNVFVSFVKLLNQFKTTLQPSLLKDSKGPFVVDKAFIENVASDLYGIPLNLSALPADDPLKILSSPDALNRLNEAGYSGNFDIKLRIIRGILAQLNSGDQKTIPASFVLFGKSGSGKTFLFSTLVKMLGLKDYDFAGDEASNQGAQVFRINVGKVTAASPLAPAGETINVQQLIEHFDRFLKLPLGKRGFVLFDDAHLSSDEVRGQIFAKIRSLFEAADGRYMGVNIRNLVLFMTFNPTIDLEKIKKVAGTSPPTPTQLALATFMGNDNKVDASFFKRWGDIINLEYFSSSAKGNELVHQLSKAANSEFNNKNTYFSVSEDTISRIVKRFPNLNARDFLSSAANSMATMVTDKKDESSLYVIAPKTRYTPGASGANDDDNDSQLVTEFVNDHFYALPFNKHARGYVHFVDLVITSFRLNLYNSLIDGITSHPAIAGQEKLQKLMLQPILEAVKAHLHEHPKMPLANFSFDLYRIKSQLPLLGLDYFDDYGDEASNLTSRPYFPTVFSNAAAQENVASYLIGASDHLEALPSRLSLVVKAWHGMEPELRRYLNRLMHTRDNELKFARVVQWAEELKPINGNDLNVEANKIVEHLLEFTDAYITDLTYIENIEHDKFASVSVYDTTRLFLLTIDKAMTQLPWDKLSIFLVRALELFSQDMSLAQYPGVQHWLFEEPRTLIRPVSRDNIFEKIRSSLLGVGEWSRTQQDSMAQGFDSKLDNLFYDSKN